MDACGSCLLKGPGHNGEGHIVDKKRGKGGKHMMKLPRLVGKVIHLNKDVPTFSVSSTVPPAARVVHSFNLWS